MTKDDVIKMAKQFGYWSGQTIEMNDVGIGLFFQAAYDAGVEAERKEFAAHAVDITRRAIKIEAEKVGQICLSIACDTQKFKAGAERCYEVLHERYKGQI